MTRLEQVNLLLDFYHAPWGAAKGVVWEDVSGDQPFDEFNITRWVQGILDGHTGLDAEQIRMLKIVADSQSGRK